MNTNIDQCRLMESEIERRRKKQKERIRNDKIRVNLKINSLEHKLINNNRME
jgi:hypothetical protein